MKTIEEQLEVILKNSVYALICEKCGGGGADGKKPCTKCGGQGLHTWETTKLADDLNTIIHQALQFKMSDLRKEVEKMKENEEYAEHDLELAATPGVIEILAKQVGKNKALDEVLLLMQK